MDSGTNQASRTDRKLCIDPPNGSTAVKANQEANGREPARLSATEFPSTRGPASGAARSESSAVATPLWLMRVWVVIRVAFFVELGMVLVVIPWTRGWTENSLLLAHPEVRFFLQNNFVRGLISGVGFIDIGLGIWEAVRYKEPPRKHKLS